jgi:hypothetical protein
MTVTVSESTGGGASPAPSTRRMTCWRLVLSVGLVPALGWSFCGHQNRPPTVFAARPKQSTSWASHISILRPPHVVSPLRAASRKAPERERLLQKRSLGHSCRLAASTSAEVSVHDSPFTARKDDDEAVVEPPGAASSSSPSSIEELQVPSVRRILGFAVPAIGVWLCSPLLSMIDTAVVGLFSGTVQQAALNPAVSGAFWSEILLA